MKKILNTCRDTGHLFGVYLRDILPLNHEVFLFKKLMAQIDTTAFWSSYYKAGGSIYNQEYMLDILLYAYCNGIYSSRKLAKATRENVAFIYLSGNTPISYRAICNFINKYQDSLSHVFIEFVRIALESGYLNKQLPFSLDGTKLKANASNKQITLYHAKREVCLFCKLRSKCITTKNDQKLGYRTLTDDGYLIYRKQMKAKMLEEQSQYIYKKRGVDVEATFGQIKHNKNFRYFTYRGLKKVKTQFLLVCLGHNINKLMRYVQNNQQKFQENLYSHYFTIKLLVLAKRVKIIPSLLLTPPHPELIRNLKYLTV